MGYDVTYHPVKPEEVRGLYFDHLGDREAHERLGVQFGLDPSDVDRLGAMWDIACDVPDETPFNKGHGFLLALVAGFLRRYWYLRGGAFSFLLEDHPEFRRYVTDWRAVVPTQYLSADFVGEINQNHCSGLYLGPDQLGELKASYQTDQEVRAAMGEVFGETLPIFWMAADYAVEHGYGLIEATDLYCPHPFQPEATKTMIPPDKCVPDGVVLYMKTAARQIREHEEHR